MNSDDLLNKVKEIIDENISYEERTDIFRIERTNCLWEMERLFEDTFIEPTTFQNETQQVKMNYYTIKEAAELSGFKSSMALSYWINKLKDKQKKETYLRQEQKKDIKPL